MPKQRGRGAPFLLRREAAGIRRRAPGRTSSLAATLAAGLALLESAAPHSSRAAALPAPSPLLPPPGLEHRPVAEQAPAPVPGLEPLRPPRATTYRAALLSALLPGAGEYYCGHTNRALIMGTLEGGIWTSYITFKVQEDLRGRRAIEYAVAFAGASAHGDEAYYKAVGQFLRSDGQGEWNEFVRRRRRDTGEVVGREYTGDEAWAWTSQTRFQQYRSLRRQKLSAGDRATNALAFALVNRIVSVVSVVQAVHRDASAAKEKGLGLKLEMGSPFAEPQARVGLWNRF